MKCTPLPTVKMDSLSLAKEIINYYIDMEQKSSEPVMYYIHREMDGKNLTNFERLSNSDYLVLKTSLPINTIPNIMKIFQSIYDGNFNSWIEILLDFDDEFEVNVEPRDLDIWIKLLERLSEDYETESNHRGDFIEDEQYYDSPPSAEHVKFTLSALADLIQQKINERIPFEIKEKVKYVSPKDDNQLTIFNMLAAFGSKVKEEIVEYEHLIEERTETGELFYKMTITTSDDDSNPKKMKTYVIDHFTSKNEHSSLPYVICLYDKKTNTYTHKA